MPLAPPAGPLGILSLATFVSTFGNGLFLTRSIGLPSGQGLFGTGMAVSSMLGPVIATATATATEHGTALGAPHPERGSGRMRR